MDFRKPPRDSHGFIYILSNESMRGIYKVGLTTNSVNQRIGELNGTGVPTTFKAERIFEVEERYLRRVEQTIHSELKAVGAHHGKEFFQIELQKCVTCAEDVIYRLTGSNAEELVGQAKRRHKEAEERRRWEQEEERRRHALLQEENRKVVIQREQWQSDQGRLLGTDAHGDLEKLLSKSFLALGIIIFLIIGIAYFSATTFFWISIVVSGIVLWLYSKEQELKREKETKARISMEQQFPLKRLSDIPRREWTANEGQSVWRGFEQEKTIHVHKAREQDRESYKKETDTKSNRKAETINPYRKGKQTQPIATGAVKPYYRTSKGIGDKRSNKFSTFHILMRDMVPTPGYSGGDFSFVRDSEIESPVRDGSKVIVSCPDCGIKCRLGAVSRAVITCPDCYCQWEQGLD